MSAQPVDVLAVRWVPELCLHPNGMHEIRGGAANARLRPLVGYAPTYALAKAIAEAHNAALARCGGR